MQHARVWYHCYHISEVSYWELCRLQSRWNPKKPEIREYCFWDFLKFRFLCPVDPPSGRQKPQNSSFASQKILKMKKKITKNKRLKNIEIGWTCTFLGFRFWHSIMSGRHESTTSFHRLGGGGVRSSVSRKTVGIWSSKYRYSRIHHIYRGQPVTLHRDPIGAGNTVSRGLLVILVILRPFYRR